MCGLAGYCGINVDENTKLELVTALAKGIDTRGGDAAGYVSISPSGLRYSRKSGKFESAKLRFLRGAARGNICMMHARYATCGKGGVEEAHPFAIRRNGRVTMWGAHNGMVPGAYASAKTHGREVDVDSQEIFELLADQNYADLQKLTGYGVITWIDAFNPDHVNVARLSKDSDFYIMPIEEGGVAWASTEKILMNALDIAGLHSNRYYDLSEIGRVYAIYPNDGVVKTEVTGVQVGDRWSRNYSFDGWQGNFYNYNFARNNVNNLHSQSEEDEMEAFWNRAMKDLEEEENKSESNFQNQNTSIINKDELPYEVWTLEDGIVGSFLTEGEADDCCFKLSEKGKIAEVYFNSHAN